MTLDEVAAKLGMSRSHAHKIERDALAKLRVAIDTHRKKYPYLYEVDQ